MLVVADDSGLLRPKVSPQVHEPVVVHVLRVRLLVRNRRGVRAEAKRGRVEVLRVENGATEDGDRDHAFVARVDGDTIVVCDIEKSSQGYFFLEEDLEMYNDNISFEF